MGASIRVCGTDIVAEEFAKACKDSDLSEKETIIVGNIFAEQGQGDSNKDVKKTKAIKEAPKDRWPKIEDAVGCIKNMALKKKDRGQ